jgi:hypothetical protein
LSEEFSGPSGDSAILASVRLKTRAVYAQARAGEAKAERCDVSLDNRLDREARIPGTYSVGSAPKAFAELSPNVQAFRQIWTDGGQRWNRDSIFVFDSSVLGQTRLFFRVPVGTPIAQEIRAVKAALAASR